MTKKIPDQELEKFIKATGWKPEEQSQDDRGIFVCQLFQCFME
jgi:hypothetical protein